ncbi:penicillin-binding protein [Devosia yakushimensis]|uniref:Penicillin-binding protein n=1 Tax=Devosia yakushimensis TaxID=470028 RepID=A0ABQ5UJD5_9HYPH|nr:serine hydrolase [Devosia yakushimensis]GLQ12167.1 penicillin-binding protein [Devosia yakushimensis]
MQFLFATLFVLGLGALPALAQETAAPDIGQILADRIARDKQGVGIVAGEIAGADITFVSSGKLAGDGAAVDEHSIFEIGSLTKLFTNLLLAQMVLEGRMDLDKPVADYLPRDTELPGFDGQAMTLFDLATHSAGLPPIPPELSLGDPANPYAAYGADNLAAFLAAYELPRAPGDTFQYSNIGIALLGQAISHVAAKPYADLVAERILTPLGMSETTLQPVDEARFASGHDAAGTAVPHWDFDVFAPAGAYRSTAEDMAKFIAAASGAAPSDLKPAFELMLARTRPAGSPNMSIGLGWMILAHPGSEIVWHNGITGGFNSFAGYNSESGEGVVVLANQVTQTGIEDIGFHLLDASLPLAVQPAPRATVEIDRAVLPGYAGEYQLGPEFHLTVTAENGRLFVKASGQDKFEVFPESATRFFYRQVDAQISFETDASGAATGLILHQNGQDIAGRKL